MSSKNTYNKTVITNYNTLLEAKKKYHTAEDSLLYYNYSRNRTISVKANDIGKEYAKQCFENHTVTSNRIKYPNYLKSRSKLERKNNLRTEGKYVDNIQESICNKSNISRSNSIKYPNYFKASSKLKEDNNSCSISENTNEERLQFQNGGEQYSCEDACLQNGNRHLEFETVIDENEKLKTKLKVVVESLREILIICDQTEDEIKNSDGDEDCQNKFARDQDDGFKFRQIHQLNENIDLFGKPFKERYRIIQQSLDSKRIMPNGASDTTGNKSDSEWVRILNSKQCLIQLQKQNRIIIRNLKELKETLGMRFTGKEFSNNKIHHYSTVRKKTYATKSIKTSAILLTEKIVTADKPTVPSKNQSEILREMVKFSKLVKDKEGCIKTNDTTNSIANPPENANSVQVRQFHSRLNKASHNSKKGLFPPLISNTHKKLDKEATVTQNIHEKNNTEKFCKRINKDNPRKPLKDSAEIKISPNSFTPADISTKESSSLKIKHRARHSYPKYNPCSRPYLSKAVKSSGDIPIVLPSAPMAPVFSNRQKIWK